MPSPLEEAVLQAALARGYVTPAQLEQAMARSRTGEGVLPLLRPLLAPAQVAELTALYRELEARARAATEAEATVAGPAGFAPLAGSEATLGGAGGERPAALVPAGVGARVGPYVIERELARGGMGTVAIARHVELDRRVALKQLLAGAAGHAAARARFEREARALAAVDHPHVVRVHEVGEGPGGPYLAMDLVEGESLAARRQREGPFEPRVAARLIEQVARALDHCHARGLLHRDLKPANVLIDADGAPRVTDFGLARDASADAEALTRTGELLGTPAFMPPEQAGGERGEVDERADVYALGATLFDLLTGRPPFVGESVANVLRQVVTEEAPAPSSLRPGLDGDLDAIVLTCLAKRPAERYPTARALADDLARYLADESIRARRAGWVTRLGRRAWRRPGLAAAAATLAMVSTLALTVALLPRPQLTVHEPPPVPVRTPPILHASVDGHGLRAVRIEAGDARALEVPVHGPELDLDLAALALADGAHEVRIVAIDLRGRESDTQTVRFELDRAAPTVRFGPPPATFGPTVRLTAEAEPGSALRLEACAGSIEPTEGGRVVLTVPLGELSAAARLVARDAAGNEARVRLPVLVVRPGEPPPDLQPLPAGASVVFLPGVHRALRLDARRPLALVAAELGDGRRAELRPSADGPLLSVTLEAGLADDAAVAPVATSVLVRGLILADEPHPPGDPDPRPAEEGEAASAPPAPPPLVTVHGGHLTLARCRLLSPGARRAIVLGARPDGGALTASLDASDLEVVRGDSEALVVGPGARAHVIGATLETTTGAGGLAQITKTVEQLADDTERSPTVRVQHGALHLERSVLRGAPGITIRVRGGTLDLVECRIEGSLAEGLLLESDPGERVPAAGHVRRCRFEQVTNVALLATRGAGLVLEDTEFARCGIVPRAPDELLHRLDVTQGDPIRPVVHVRGAAAGAIVRRCVLRDGGEGVKVSSTRDVLLEEVTARGNQGRSFSVIGPSSVRLVRCRSVGGLVGLWVAPGGEARHGVPVTADVTVEGGSVGDARETGVIVLGRSKAALRDLTVTDSGGHGVLAKLDGGAAPALTLERCAIERSAQAGVLALGPALLKLRDTSILRSGQHGVVAAGLPGARPAVTLERVIVRDGKGAGLATTPHVTVSLDAETVLEPNAGGARLELPGAR